MSFFRKLLGLDHIDERAKVVWREPPPPLPPAPHGYRIYTTEFDEAITLPQIPARVEPLSPQQIEEFATIKQQYQALFTKDRLLIQEAAGEFIRKLVSHHTQAERAKTIVTILIDHSGSMRGMGILSACLSVDAIWQALDRCGVPSEIIGFTTCSWKGGQSRVKWIREGRPPNPGRLCDLRHILYRTAGDARGKPPEFVNALHPELLRENVDGEAILYAVGRLEGGDWRKRAVVVVSDGAPVDDSTLASNSDSQILLDHLKQVIGEVEAKGIGMGYVLLEERARAVLPENSITALEPVAAARALFDVTARALGLDRAETKLDPAST